MENKVKEPKKNLCPICEREFTERGHDPFPVCARGRVCDECNYKVIIPTRLLMAEYINKVKFGK